MEEGGVDIAELLHVAHGLALGDELLLGFHDVRCLHVLEVSHEVSTYNLKILSRTQAFEVALEQTHAIFRQRTLAGEDVSHLLQWTDMGCRRRLGLLAFHNLKAMILQGFLDDVEVDVFHLCTFGNGHELTHGVDDGFLAHLFES